MSPDATSLLDRGYNIYSGHDYNHTVEGPKLYKKNGYYYIMAPAGGVATGWQLVLRSKGIYGSYEEKIVMAQGSTDINGPHQGAYIETQNGEPWFLHFQDRGVYGRILHLNPVTWVDGWPVMGVDNDGDGCGERSNRTENRMLGANGLLPIRQSRMNLMIQKSVCSGVGMPMKK